MGGIDPNISNGTCYFAEGAQAADNFIPCGNAGIEGYEKPCCNVGDKCLSSSACFNTKYSITYLVGCTDRAYGAPQCPGKGPYAGQQLVGLTRCDPDTTEWAGCADEEGRTKPEPRQDNCTCEGQDPLFEGGAKLEDIAFLPQSSGGRISWFQGHSPTMTSTQATATATSPVPSGAVPSLDEGTPVDASATPTPTPTDASSNTAPPPPAETLSVGAIAGISVGAVGFILFLGCLIFMGCFFRRRNKNQQQSQQQQQEPHNGNGYNGAYAHAHSHSSPPLPTTTDPAGNTYPTHHHPGLSGFKSELPADVPEKTPSSTYGHGHGHGHGNVGEERFSTVSTLSSQQGGGGFLHSPNLSVYSTPQHTGQDGLRRTDETAGLAPISELHG